MPPQLSGASSPATDVRDRRVGLDDVEVARARWQLRFYCWRRILTLSVGTAACCESIIAVVEGRQPQALDILLKLLENVHVP